MDYHNIVFFDGYCILCNKFIDLSLKIDRRKKLYYSMLDSKYAEKLFNEINTHKSEIINIDSVIYFKDKKIYSKSNAVIEIIRDLGGIYKTGILLYVVPQKIRDWCYDLVAKNRYSLFGKMDHCRTISLEERGRILE